MKKRILIIDNDTTLNSINEKLLLSSGLASELHIATNGKKGLEYLVQRIEKGYMLPEIIILELNLPVMSGLEFLAEFQQLDFVGKENIELVVFTSSNSFKDRQQALSNGVKYILNKPYILTGLQDVIMKIEAAKTRKKYIANY